MGTTLRAVPRHPCPPCMPPSRTTLSRLAGTPAMKGRPCSTLWGWGGRQTGPAGSAAAVMACSQSALLISILTLTLHSPLTSAAAGRCVQRHCPSTPDSRPLTSMRQRRALSTHPHKLLSLHCTLAALPPDPSRLVAPQEARQQPLTHDLQVPGAPVQCMKQLIALARVQRAVRVQRAQQGVLALQHRCGSSAARQRTAGRGERGNVHHSAQCAVHSTGCWG